MIKWIKNLFVSKRLRAANERIEELETKVKSLEDCVALLEDTFIPKFNNESPDAALKTLPNVPLVTRHIHKVFRLLKLTFNNSKLA